MATEEGVTRADVLATHAEMAGEIDVDAARRRLEEWEDRTDEEDDDRAQAEIAKARARIAIAGELSGRSTWRFEPRQALVPPADVGDPVHGARRTPPA